MQMNEDIATYAIQCVSQALRHYRLPDEVDWRDLRQDALALVIRRFPRYDRTRSSVRTYVSMLSESAVREVMGKFRRRMAREPVECMDPNQLAEAMDVQEAEEQGEPPLTEVQMCICNLASEGCSFRRIRVVLGITRARLDRERRAAAMACPGA